MAGKNKLRKFAEITSLPNVLEAFTFDDGLLNINDLEKVRMKGQWGVSFFKNPHPIGLELACGKGEYTLGLGRMYLDPFLRLRDEKRRLTSKPFLDRYTRLLNDGAFLHLKTDSDALFEFSQKTIHAHPHFSLIEVCEDVDRIGRSEEMAIRTYYEEMHLQEGKSIKYICARFNK